MRWLQDVEVGILGTDDEAQRTRFTGPPISSDLQERFRGNLFKGDWLYFLRVTVSIHQRVLGLEGSKATVTCPFRLLLFSALSRRSTGNFQ